MIRGTTPTLEFVLPFDTSLLAEAFVTLKQRGDVVLEKALNDCACSKHVLSVKLTQEETLKLECSCNVELQIRARTTDGNAIASEIITESVGKILKEGVI